MSGVVSLQLLVHIKQDDHGGDEIHRFSSGEQVKVGATVSTAVAIAEQESGQGMKEKQNPKWVYNTCFALFSLITNSYVFSFV